MSYILDALRKSDRERAVERVVPEPSGVSPGFRAGTTAPQGRRIVAVALGIALLAGIGAGLWLGRQTPAVIPASPTVAAPPEALDAQPSPSPDALAQTDTAEPGSPDAAAAAIADDAVENAPARPAGILELWQLTEAEQRYLQALDVTLHVHSSDPAQRAVIINGLRAREGQDLGEALRLAEIVPDGLILEFQGQLVHLPNPQPY